MIDFSVFLLAAPRFPINYLKGKWSLAWNMRPPMHSVTVIIPAYNEEKLIAKTLGGIPSFINSIIVIDDASTDDTAGIVNRCMKLDRRIKLISHRKNGGVGKALSSGYKAFLDGDGSIAVVMNADAQMDPGSLPAIIASLQLGEADYVGGNRFAKGQVIRHMPPNRLLANLAVSAIVSLATLRLFVDVSSGYTAITRDALLSLNLDELFPGYGVPIDILLKLHHNKMRIKSVPIPTIYNGSTSGIRPVPYARAVFSILLNNHEEKK